MPSVWDLNLAMGPGRPRVDLASLPPLAGTQATAQNVTLTAYTPSIWGMLETLD